MTPKTKAALIKSIHTGVGWCTQNLEGFTDTTYRSILTNYGGATGEPPSSKEQGVDLRGVLARLHELGFPDTRPASAGAKPHGAPSKQALLGKIDAYLAEAGKSTNYAVGIARRMYKIEKLEWLSIDQLKGVVTALEKAAQKAGRATA